MQLGDVAKSSPSEVDGGAARIREGRRAIGRRYPTLDSDQFEEDAADLVFDDDAAVAREGTPRTAG